MKNRLSNWLLVIVAVIVLWYVLSRLHIVVFVPVSPWGLALMILGAIVVLYLAVDYLIHRIR